MEHQSIYRSNPSKPSPERNRSYNDDPYRKSSRSSSSRSGNKYDDKTFSKSSRSGKYYSDDEVAKSSRSKRHFDDEEFTSSGYYSSSRSSYSQKKSSQSRHSDSRKNNSYSFEEVNHAKSKYVPKNKPIIKDSRSDGRKKRRIISYVYILIAAVVLVASVPLNKSFFDKMIESGKDIEVIPDAVVNLIPLSIL